MTEHAAAARAWWHDHGVDARPDESPWLVTVSDVHIPVTKGRSMGEVRALQGLGSSAYLLGTLTGRFPASIVIAVPDAGDRHKATSGGTGQLKDYWPAGLRGVKPKALTCGLGRHAWTVGGDGAAAFVAEFGLTPPVRVLSSPVVMPAWRRDGVVVVDPDVYVAPVPVTVGREAGVPAKPAVEQVNVAAVVDRAATRLYIAALHPVVVDALTGTTPTLMDVIRACAVATVAVPTPAGAAEFNGGNLAGLLITKGGVAPALNVAGVRDAIAALVA